MSDPVRRLRPSAAGRSGWDWTVVARFATVLMAGAVIVAAGFAISTSGALSQAYCQESYPAAESTVARAPAEVLLWFSESVNPAYSTFAVSARNGRSLAGPPRISADGRRVALPISGDADGTYVVRYQVSTTGGNLAAGFFRYRVGATSRVLRQAAPLEQAFRWLTVVSLAALAAWWLRSGAVPPTPSVLVGAVAVLSLGALAWATRAAAFVDASIAGALTAGLAWPMLAGTHVGSGLLLAAATMPVLMLPPSPRGRLLRIALPCLLALGLSLIVLSGGLLHLVGSAHFAPVALMLAAYALATVVAAAILPDLGGVRVPVLPWTHVTAVALLLVAAAFFTAEGRTPSSVAALTGYLGASACWLGAAGQRGGRLTAYGFAAALAGGAFASAGALANAGGTMSPAVAAHAIAGALAAGALIFTAFGGIPRVPAAAAAAFLFAVTFAV